MSALPPKIVSIRHGCPHARRCAGGGICSVINNSGGSRNLMIKVTIQLTSTRLVVRKSVDERHGMHAGCAILVVEPTATMRLGLLCR